MTSQSKSLGLFPVVKQPKNSFYHIPFCDLVDVSLRFHSVSCGTKKRYASVFFFWGGLWAPFITAKRIQSDPAEITFRRWSSQHTWLLVPRKGMLTPLSCRSINLAFRKGAIVRHGQTYDYFSMPTVLISLLYLFRQNAYFSTVLISLPSLFQCCKFFQRVPKTLTMYLAIK